MTADAGVLFVRPDHHGHGVPANQGFDTPLQLTVAGKGRLLVGGNGIQIGGVGAVG